MKYSSSQNGKELLVLRQPVMTIVAEGLGAKYDWF
jgi:hypothetical protein